MKAKIAKALSCGIALYLFSLVLGAVLLPIGFIYVLWASLSKRRVKAAIRLVDRKFKRMAISVDILANITCEEMLNAYLITDSEIKFGNYGETISEVLGWNKMQNTLTKEGELLVGVLNIFEKDHCLKAVDFKSRGYSPASLD